ncbi:MAG: hypothetical protein R3E95_11660 [Thiolinea sp.]
MLPKSIDESSFDSVRNAGNFTAILQRANFVLPTRESCGNLPVSDICPAFHLTGKEGRELLPFEGELEELVKQFNASGMRPRRRKSRTRCRPC